MSFTANNVNQIFNQGYRRLSYHDDIDTNSPKNPYDRDPIENRLYLKC